MNNDTSKKVASVVLAAMITVSPLANTYLTIADENTVSIPSSSEAALNKALLEDSSLTNNEEITSDTSSIAPKEDSDTSSKPEDTSETSPTTSSDSEDSSSSSSSEVTEKTQLVNPLTNQMFSVSYSGSVVGGVLYATNSPTVTLNNSLTSGYQDIRLVGYSKDKSVPNISSYAEYELSGADTDISLLSSGSATLAQNMKYIVVFIYNGNDAEIKNRSIDNMGVISQPAYRDLGSNIYYVQDTSGAAISNVKINGNNIDHDSWYSSKSLNITFDVIDSISPLTSVKVNGVSVEGPSYAYTIDSSSMETGSYSINIETTVASGKVQTYSTTIKVDTKSPSISVNKVEGLLEKEGKFYIKDSFKMYINAADAGSGVSSIRLNGNIPSEDYYLITSLGDEFRVLDTAGNVTIYTALELMEAAGYKQGENLIFSNGRSDIVSSVESDTVYEKTVEGENQKWYKGNPNVKFQVFNNSLTEVNIYINGILANGGSQIINGNGIYMVTTAGLSGRIDVACSTTDVYGGTSTETITLHLDTGDPELSNANVSGTGTVYNGTIYSTGTFTVTGTVSDNGVGVKGYEIIKDGQTIISVDSEDLSYEITESGSYSIAVVDLVGNRKIYGLNDISSFDTSNIIIDTVNPVISAKVGDTNLDELEWINSRAGIDITVTDDNLEEVTVNGEVVKLTNNVYNYKVSSEGENTLRVIAIDYAGNRVEKEYAFKADFTAPDLSTISHSALVGFVNGDKYYSNEPIVLSGEVTDNFGISNVTIYKDDREVYTSSSESVDYTLSGTGSYEIEAEDLAGNKVRSSLKDILGISVDNIIIDTVKPTISATIDGSSFVNGTCYNTHPIIKLGIVDSNLESVTVNGESVSLDGNYYNYDTATLSDGTVSLNVVAMDKAGNRSEETFSINLDYSGPVVSDLELSSFEGKVHDNIQYVKGSSIKLQGSVTDDISGIDGAILKINPYSGSEHSKSITPVDGILTLNETIDTNGIYTLTVTDKLGNSTTLSLNDLIGNGTTGFIFDTEAPTITGEPVVSDYNGWYKTGPKFNIQIKDVNLNPDSVVITGAKFTKESDNSYIIDTSNLEGTLNISVYAEDYAGNSYTKTYEVKNDFTAPRLNVKFTPDKGGQLVGNTYYFGTSIIMDGTVIENGSGVKSITVNGESIYNPDTGVVNFTLDKSGTYELSMEDNIGNTYTCLLNDILDGGQNFFMDTNAPTISATIGGEPIVEGMWLKYSSNPVVDVYIEDPDNLLYTSSVTVSSNSSSDIYDSQASADGSDVANGHYSINVAEHIQDGTLVLSIAGMDRAKNSVSKVYNIHVDSTPVDLSVLNLEGSMGAGYTVGDTYYARGTYTLSGKLSDGVGSGISEAEISHQNADGSTSVDKLVVNEDGTVDVSYPFDTDGTYTLVVVDRVGNQSSILLTKLAGSDATRFVFDGVAPTVSFKTSHAGTILDNKLWFKEKPGITVSIDDENLKNAFATITAGGHVSTVDLFLGDNDLGVIDAEGETRVVVSAVDQSGNDTKDGNTFTIYNDTINPEPRLSFDRTGKSVDGVYYATGTLKLSGKVTDSGSGMKYVKIYKDGVPVKEFSDGNVDFDVKETGSYTIEYSDNVGNVVTEKLNNFLNGEGSSSSSFVFDNDAPVLNATVGGKSFTDAADYEDFRGVWFKSSPSVELHIEDDNLKSFTVDGITHLPSELVNNIFTVSTEGKEGRIDIVVGSEDKAGNISSQTYTLYTDYTKPTLGSISVEFDNNGDDDEDYKYISGTITFSGNAEDGRSGDPSGIQKVELVKGSTVIGLLDENNPINPDNNYVVSDGSYSLRITDNVGNVTDIPLNSTELLNSKSNIIRFDSDAPVIGEFRVSGYDSTLVREGKTWYKGNPNVSFNVEDRYIKEVTGTINENVELSDSKTGDFTIKTDKYSNQEVRLQVNAKDKAGNTSDSALTYWQDNTPPTMSSEAVISSAPSNEKGGKVFYKTAPSVQFEYSDGEGVGLDKYILEGHETPETTNGTYNNLTDGNYILTVKDLLGNTTEPKTLAELVGWKGNTLVIDGESPTAKITRDAIKYNDGTTDWYNSDFNIHVDLTDNVGIDSAELLINGEVVDSFNTTSTEEKSAILTANTSKVSPDAAGGYKIEVRVTDNAKNIYETSDYAKIDKTLPVVSRFVITGTVNEIGKDSNGSDEKYGFFFDGKGSVEVTVSDEGITSGIKSIFTKLDGRDWVEHTIKNNVGSASVKVDVPASYKGMIYAYAVDNVNNKGPENQPDGLVSEDEHTHNNSKRVDITLPATRYSDSNGLPLYSGDTKADVTIGCDWSGLQKLEWGIGDRTYETITDFSSAKIKDKNLSLSMDKVMSMEGNANNLRLWVRITDMTNHTSENFKEFSIDKDVPVINVSWNTTEGDNYYSVSRVATVHISERNFDPSQVSIGGTSGSLSGWSQSGDGWTATISCDSDNDYNFTIDAVDRAGNRAVTYSSGQFTVDKTAPVMQVSWDNNSFENGKYYKNPRTATITVTEHNFDASRMQFSGNGTLSGWSNNGDVHTAQVSFTTDGEYSFQISGSDMADNAIGTPYSSGDFVIDTTNPGIKITGVSEGTSYKDSLVVGVDVSDTYVDVNRTYAILTGKNHDAIRLEGIIGTSGGHYEFSDFPVEELTDDVYHLEVVVVDLAGNEVHDEVTFSVNRFGSKFGFRDADILGNYISKAIDVVISETNVDKLDTDAINIVVTRDGSEIEVPENLVSIDMEEVEGKYVYTYTIHKELFDKDGVYSVQVFSRSLDGTDYTSAAETYDFILDTTAPEVIVSGVETDGRYQAYEKEVTVDIRDISGISDMKVELNGKDVEVTEDENGIYHLSVLEMDDTQDLKVTVTDLAGNTTEMEVNNFLVTSNPWAFILNQWWFWTAIAAIGASITGLIAVLIKRRKDENAHDKESLRTSERLTQSSSISSQTSSHEGAGVISSCTDDDGTKPLSVEGENEKTDIMDD